MLLVGRGVIAAPLHPDGWRWIVDAHREGRRYMVHSDELLSAFLELEQTLLLLRNQWDKDNPGVQQISWTPLKVGAHPSGRIKLL